MTAPGIPNDFVLSTSCFGTRLRSIEDQAFAAVAMGFRQIELGLSESPPTLNGFEDTRRETGMKVSSVVAGCLKPRTDRMACVLLASSNDDERMQAVNSVRRHLQLAQRLASPTLVVRGSSVADANLHREAQALATKVTREGLSDELREEVRDLVRRVQRRGQRQIEHLCRSLHQLLVEFEATRIAIEPGMQLDDLLSFEAMGWVLDDLGRHGLGYWHDVGRVHARSRMGLPGQGQWLDAYSDRMVGVHLQDADGLEVQMPPGQGEVDFKLLAEYVPKGASKVLEIDERHGRTEILNSVTFLRDKGF